MDFNFEEIVKICNAYVLSTPNSLEFKVGKAVIDSRKIEQNDIFFAMSGNNVDGHDFVESAIVKKSSLIVCQKDLDDKIVNQADINNVGIIKVNDCEKALQLIANAWRKKLKSKVLGITGSVGKTTVKKLCYDVLSSEYKVHCNTGNLNNELGLPMTICSCPFDVEYLITEMGMSAQGQIQALCDIANPDWGLISNVGIAHIEHLKSQDNIAKAKSELAMSIPSESGVMFLNKADKYCDYIIAYAQLVEKNIDIVLFGDDKRDINSNCMQVWYENTTINNDGTWNFDLCFYDNKTQSVYRKNCKLQLKGKHNIINSCAAAAVGIYANIDLDYIIKALGESEPEHGRQEMLRADLGFSIINDAYNANPSSMVASIDTFSSITFSGKKFAFLGDMFELGNFSKQGHAQVGECVAQSNIDYLFCVGDQSRYIVQAAQENMMPPSHIFWFMDSKSAKQKLLDMINANDVVLFKASNGMKFYDIVNELVS